MTKFEPSAHADLLSQLDKHNEQTVEYWSKRKNENLPRWDTRSLWYFDVWARSKRV